MVEEKAFWLAWSQISGIGPTLIFRLNKFFGSLETAWEAEIQDLLHVEGVGLQTAQAIANQRSHLRPGDLLEQHLHHNPCFWTPADPDYPRLLLEISDPPPVLYYRGIVEAGENQGMIPAIALVGTRQPSEYGRRWTRRISKALAQAGLTVVSGLAEGIDAEAHRSCLDAMGRTIAVIATGVNIIYPWTNRKLAQEIVQNGLIVSEYPIGTKPDRVNFPRRNRIIAGLCRAVLVLEAPAKSGALITARLATDYNRDVYALPASLDQEQSHGCLKLISDGAHLILNEHHLLDMLSTLPALYGFAADRPKVEQLPLLAASPPIPPDLEPNLEQVLNAITTEPIALDFIVEAADLPTGTVLGALSQLELLGLVSLQPGMLYQRC